MNPRTPLSYHAGEIAPAGSGVGTALPPGLAIASLFSAIVAFALSAALLVPVAGAIVATMVAEVTFILVPIAWMMVGPRLSASYDGVPAIGIADALGLRRPAAVFVVAAVLIGATQWISNLALAYALGPWLGAKDTGTDQLSHIVNLPSLLLVVMTVAVMPPICEEILFRGVLVRGLATRFVPLASIAISAIAFSAFHLSFVRAVPTLMLGLVYGYIALRSRSVIPTIIAHALNNLAPLLIERGHLSFLTRLFNTHPVALVSVASGATAAGIILVARSHR
jgi:membrane protease YdiL (CAAX protease family)